MQKAPPPEEAKDVELIPRWTYIGGGIILLVTAIAAPFYGSAMAGLIWAGEAIQALCGW